MIVGILGPGGCGGTFLDWTIQYLSGQTETWHIICDPSDRSRILSQKCRDLVDNPIENNTAHKHAKTHPDENSVDDVIEAFREHPEFELNSFYFVDSLGAKRTQTEYNQMIFTYDDIKFITYNFTESNVDIIFCLQYEKISAAKNKMDQYIMSHSKIPLNQMPVWDRRELLSLYYPGEIKGQTTAEKILDNSNNFTLDFDTAIEELDTVIPELFDYLNLKIVDNRYSSWNQIYTDWKSSINLKFFKNLNNIIQDILSNTPHDLSQYNMSFAKEVVIASKLLYNHNLALKAYNKDNLSQNTQQWTEILEPNIYHNLTEQ